MSRPSASTPVGLRVDILILMYGDYPEMHRRLLRGLTPAQVPVINAVLHIWGNQLGAASRKLVTDFCAERGDTAQVTFSDVNVSKYTVMKKLMTQELFQPECWFLWLDDDVQFTAQDWFLKALEFIQQKLRSSQDPAPISSVQQNDV